MSEFFFNLITVSGKIGEGVHIVCSNVLVGGASSPSLTGFPACSTNSDFFGDGFLSCQQPAFRPVPQKVIFFGKDRHYQHNFFPKRRQVRYDVISRSVLAGSSR